MMKLSIIVPVYNVEEYLPRCLDSLLRQGLEVGEYEVICVNDGSPDNSAAILAEYETKHPDIFKVITQENQGIGKARNAGMRMARGEWIAFVDSDDYLVDGGYGYILAHFCEEGVDVVNFNCVPAYTDGQSLYDPDAKPDGEISFNGDGAEAYNRLSLPYVWSKLYRRSFLEKNGIFFESAFMEDEPFNFQVFRHSPRLCIVTSNIYRYEQGNVNSLLTSAEKENVKGQLLLFLPIIEEMNHYLQDDRGKMVPAARRIVNSYLRTYYNKMLKARLAKREWKEYSLLLKEHSIYKIDVSAEPSCMGKTIAYLKNVSVTSYPVYLMVEFLLRVFFTDLIRPRIIASYSK